MAPVPATRPRPWQVFAYRDYRFLWAATVASTTALWMRILGTSQWLLDETGSAVLVGAIGVVQLVVQIPALLWGGTLADRFDRKRLMMFANGLTAIVLISLGAMNTVGWLSPLWVYVGIALTAMSQMISSPARSALIPIIFPQRLLLVATSTDTASANATAIIGPLIFAAIATTAGLSTVFLVAGAFAAVSALLPPLLRAAGRASGHETTGSAVQQTVEGFRGFLGAANSTGAIIGSFIALLFVAYRAKGMLVLYASLAYGVILFGFGLANTLLLGMVAIALLGAADSVTVAVRQTTVMLTTPDHMRGRAFALLILAAQTANNVGTIWVGAWAGAIGASNTMVLGGVISIVATLAIWRFWKPIREFRSNE